MTTQAREQIVLRRLQGTLDHVMAFLRDWENRRFARGGTYRINRINCEGKVAWYHWGVTKGGRFYLCGGVTALERPGGNTTDLTFRLYSSKPQCIGQLQQMIGVIGEEMERLNFFPDDSDRYAYPYRKRLEIVLEHHRLKAQGRITNTAAWVEANYDISGRTFRDYRNEFK